MTDPAADPRVQELRREISAADRALLDAVNRRLGLVEQMFAHKKAMGYPILDAGREAALVAELQASNAGPLSGEGVAELVTFVLALAKREVERRGA